MPDLTGKKKEEDAGGKAKGGKTHLCPASERERCFIWERGGIPSQKQLLGEEKKTAYCFERG